MMSNVVDNWVGWFWFKVYAGGYAGPGHPLGSAQNAVLPTAAARGAVSPLTAQTHASYSESYRSVNLILSRKREVCESEERRCEGVLFSGLCRMGGGGATTLNPKPQTPNPKPQTPNPKSQTPNSKTPNPKNLTPIRSPITLNPKP